MLLRQPSNLLFSKDAIKTMLKKVPPKMYPRQHCSIMKSRLINVAGSTFWGVLFVEKVPPKMYPQLYTHLLQLLLLTTTSTNTTINFNAWSLYFYYNKENGKGVFL